MKKILKPIGYGLLVCCCLFTIFSGAFFVNYFEQIVKSIQVMTLIENKFLWETDKDIMIEGAIEGAVAALGDRYSAYLDEQSIAALLEDVTGTISGIGVYVGIEDNQIVVVAPIKGGPSEQAGIQAGDIIMQVDGTSVGGMGLDEVVIMMKGEAGSSVDVMVSRPSDKQLHTFTITRDVIDVPTIEGKILEENKDIAYIQISKFSSNTDEAFVETLNELIQQGFKGLIIDLRDNGGGDVNAATGIAALLVPDGPIVHIVDKNDNVETISSPGAQLEVPMVVLVNGRSASASEILAGAMKDTQVATLVGTKTFGKGLVQGVFFLNDGTALKLTQSKYLTPNKNDINQLGIEPNVVIDFPADMTEATYVDVQLEKGIEVLERAIQ